MIGYLNGILHTRHDPFLLINVNGVGYKVHATHDILAAFHVGDSVELFIHTHVREDALELYGFPDEASLELFQLLISVSGIGPKTAIGIFATRKKDEILQAIRQADVDFFTAVPRLGRKNAQKLIIELKNKLAGVEEIDLGEGDSDVVMALTQFGFTSDEARRAVREVGEGTAEAKIKKALKYLGK